MQLIEYSTESEDRMTERVQRDGSAPLVYPGDRWASWATELPAAAQRYSEGLPGKEPKIQSNKHSF